jgi:hypothetical protein
MLCSICFNDIPSVNGWDSGNNAAPINYGRCCKDCDNNIVIPARINMIVRKISNKVFMEMQREAARRFADQNFMLTPTELEAVERVIHTVGPCTDSATLRGLLVRLLGEWDEW